MSTLGQRIRSARQALGLTQKAIAERYAIDRVSVTQWESDITRPDQTKLPDLAQFLNVELRWLMEEVGTGPPQEQTMTRLHEPTRIFSGRAVVGDRDLPVYAATRGGDGEMLVSTDVVEYTKRPSELDGVRDGYAIRVIGDSMSKAYREGDLALVHPNLRPQNDEVHIFYDQDPRTGDAETMIKNLLGWNNEKWRLEQFNPEKRFSVDRIDWPICHRVVGKYNRR